MTSESGNPNGRGYFPYRGVTMSARQPTIRTADEGAWVGWMGEPLRYATLGADTLDRYALSVGGVAAGGGPKPHSHGFAETFVLFRGSATFTAGNRTIEVPTGGAVTLGPGTAHYFRAGPDGADLFVLVGPAGFDRFQLEAGDPLPGPGAPVPPFDPVRYSARVTAVAPNYPIEMNPPPDAFARAPNVRAVPPGRGRTIGTAGDVYRFLATGDDTGGAYALWEAVVPPGGGPPPHVHSREDEGFYVLEGEVTFTVNGERVVATAGTCANMPPGVPHHFRNESDRPARMLILVAPAGLEQMFFEVGRELPEGATTTESPTSDEIERLLRTAPKYGIEIRAPGTP